MPRAVWTEDAEEQLAAVASDETVEELLALAAGLARLPQRGRHVPEFQGRPENESAREVILPRGGAYHSCALGPRFEQD